MAGNSTRLSRLLLAYERYDAAWRRRREFTSNERLVVLLLADGGPTSPKNLSELVGVTTAGMTGLLDRLEAEGFVKRRRHPDDGRWVLVFPTKRALRAHDEFQQVLEGIVKGGGSPDSEAVSDFLDRIAAGLLRAAAD